MAQTEHEIVSEIGSDYAAKYGFHNGDTPEDYFFKSGRGLSHELVEMISEHKNEPDWMRKFRHKSLDYFYARPMPEWGGNLGDIDHIEAVVAKLLAERAPGGLLVAHQLAAALVDRRQLLTRGQPVGADRRDVGAHLAAQAGDPHHEELIEVVGRDRQEPQAFQERMVLVPRLLQHPLVERQPGQLAVHEPAELALKGRRNVVRRLLTVVQFLNRGIGHCCCSSAGLSPGPMVARKL